MTGEEALLALFAECDSVFDGRIYRATKVARSALRQEAVTYGRG